MPPKSVPTTDLIVLGILTVLCNLGLVYVGSPGWALYFVGSLTGLTLFLFLLAWLTQQKP